MLSIGEAHFHIDVAHLGEVALEQFARTLFHGFEEKSGALPLEDFGLSLEIEAGSIRGKGRILTTLAVLYIGIGEYGDFVQGVREIANVSRSVVSSLVSDAPKKLERPNTLTWNRSNAARLGGLERLFLAVKAGVLQPDEATQKAIELLSEDDQLPQGFAVDIEASLCRIVKDPQQLDWVLPDDDAEVDTKLAGPTTSSKAPRTRSLDPQAPTRKLRVEIRKSSKREKPTLVIIES